MNSVRRILNKWQFICNYGNDPYRLYGRQITIGLINLTSFPENGKRINRRHHKGIAFSFRIYGSAITFRRRYFQILGMEQMVTYPVWISLKDMFYVEVW
jgi:hypothetical protein